MPDSARVVLLLQGPTSPFFSHLGRELRRRGATVLRINLCPGDALYWRGPGAIAFRGRPEHWRDFVAGVMTRHGVTDIALVGDSRFYHAEAILEAQARGIAVHSVELGLLRPDWLTVEPDGSGSHSRFPRDPAAIHALAQRPRAEGRRFPGSFLRYATLDVTYHLLNVALAPLRYPHYLPHGVDHPLVEYPAWIVKLAKGFALGGRWRREADDVLAGDRPFILLPLQLKSDFQIRVHAPDRDLIRTVRTILASFAAHAPEGLDLVVKVHPLDNGLTPWRTIVDDAAAAGGALARVTFLDAGDTDRLIERSSGVVTVNSTVGLTAIRAGRPVIALGNAAYDVPGLTHQGSLDSFWGAATPPDRALRDAFIAALQATTQVPGTFDGPGARVGAAAVAERILDAVELPPATQARSQPVAYRRDAAGNPV